MFHYVKSRSAPASLCSIQLYILELFLKSTYAPLNGRRHHHAHARCFTQAVKLAPSGGRPLYSLQQYT